MYSDISTLYTDYVVSLITPDAVTQRYAIINKSLQSGIHESLITLAVA